MSDRHELIDDLMAAEGTGPMKNGRHLPYLDCCGKVWRLCTCKTKGHLTIGYGRNLDANGLSRREASDALDHDIDETVSDLAGAFPWFVFLDAIRQRAVVELRFNLGPDGFRKFKRMIAALAAQDYSKAASELRDSDWFTDVQASRASRLLHMLATGTDE